MTPKGKNTLKRSSLTRVKQESFVSYCYQNVNINRRSRRYYQQNDTRRFKRRTENEYFQNLIEDIRRDGR